ADMTKALQIDFANDPNSTAFAPSVKRAALAPFSRSNDQLGMFVATIQAITATTITNPIATHNNAREGARTRVRSRSIERTRALEGACSATSADSIASPTRPLMSSSSDWTCIADAGLFRGSGAHILVKRSVSPGGSGCAE